MKKILISALFFFGIALSASAHGYAEMPMSINDLQTAQTKLPSENAVLDEPLADLGVDLAALRKMVPGIPDTLRTATDSMQAVFIAYCTSETPEKASQYIMDAQRVKPLMMKYYEEVKDWEIGDWEWYPDMKFEFIRTNVYYYPHYLECYLVKTPSGYKIDWEATVKYNPYILADLETHPNQIFEMRTEVEKSLDYVNDHWVEYSFTHDGYLYNIYARKSNPQIKKLDRWIKQKLKPVIIKLKWVPSDSSFELVGFVCAGCSKYQLNTQHASSLNR